MLKRAPTLRRLGIQAFSQDSRENGSGFWVNDGDGPLLRFGMRAAQIVDVEMVFLAPVETLFVLLRHLAVGEIRFVSVLSARRKYTSEQHNERNQNAEYVSLSHKQTKRWELRLLA